MLLTLSLSLVCFFVSVSVGDAAGAEDRDVAVVDEDDAAGRWLTLEITSSKSRVSVSVDGNTVRTRFSLGLIAFYEVLQVFYWVSLGFTGFYEV